MSTVDDVVPFEPAAAPEPAGSWLAGPLADSIALVSAALTLIVLSGITPIEPVPALAATLNVLRALVHGGGVPAVPSAALIQATIVVLLLAGNVGTDARLLMAPTPISSRVIGAIALGLALLWATATFLVLGGLTWIAPVDEVVKQLLLGNAVTGLLLLSIIGREVWVVVQARRRGHAGSRLHIQIVSLFAVIAAVPTILIALVASTTLDRGLDRYFSTRTRAMIEQSLIVATAYVNEHAAAIHGEIMAMAYDLSRAKPIFDQDRDQFRRFLAAQAKGRNLAAALIIKPDGSVVERADVDSSLKVVLPSAQVLSEVTDTEPRVELFFGRRSCRRGRQGPGL